MKNWKTLESQNIFLGAHKTEVFPEKNNINKLKTFKKLLKWKYSVREKKNWKKPISVDDILLTTLHNLKQSITNPGADSRLRTRTIPFNEQEKI